MTVTTGYFVRSLVLLLSITFLWWGKALGKIEEECMNDGDETCQASVGSNGNNDFCLENTLLIDGFPGDDDDDATVRSTSLKDDEAAKFPKISRFSEEFDQRNNKHFLHISANGDHEGWFVRLPSSKCLKVAKRLVAREIIALLDDIPENIKQIDLRGPHRLVDEEGKVFPEDTDSKRLHLLFPREAFVHEAVSEGFVRTLSDRNTTLTTVSLSPRVFVVDPILPIELCDELIDNSKNRFRLSGEHHYSDEYKNYRTSLSGHTPSNAKATKELWKRVFDITGMPRGGVELPQLLKYETDASWYKKHHDFFHSFEDRPLEDMRVFVKVRAQELLRLNVLDIVNVLKDGEASLTSFDDPDESPLDYAIGMRLAERLGLTNKDDIDERRLVHDFVMESNDPVQDFARVAVEYAAELLETNGASQPQSLAEKYFRLEDPTDEDIEDYVPYILKPVQVNRHVTMLPILRAAERGGFTAFPSSGSSLGAEPDADEEIQECKTGLIVKPKTGQAVMFYNRLPRGELDYTSHHAGCPCKEGEKFAANCFTWDSDQSWAYRFLGDIDDLYG